MNDKPTPAPEMIAVPKKPRPKEATSYFEMSQNSVGTDDNSHAFLIGSGGAPPYPPSLWEADRNNIEPPLGENVNFVGDLTTTPHGGSALAVPPAEACPYATDEGCHLVRHDIGPCLCGATP